MYHCSSASNTALIQWSVQQPANKSGQVMTNLHSNDILSIDFCDEVVSQHPVTCSRRILHNLPDLAVTESKSHVVVAILLHGDSALKGTVTHSNGNFLRSSLLEDLIDCVFGVACYRFPIDLHQRRLPGRGRHHHTITGKRIHKCQSS